VQVHRVPLDRNSVSNTTGDGFTNEAKDSRPDSSQDHNKSTPATGAVAASNGSDLNDEASTSTGDNDASDRPRATSEEVPVSVDRGKLERLPEADDEGQHDSTHKSSRVRRMSRAGRKTFIPKANFSGNKRGYVYKANGDRGSGYYLERSIVIPSFSASTSSLIDQNVSSPTSSVEGPSTPKEGSGKTNDDGGAGEDEDDDLAPKTPRQMLGRRFSKMFLSPNTSHKSAGNLLNQPESPTRKRAVSNQQQQQKLDEVIIEEGKSSDEDNYEEVENSSFSSDEFGGDSDEVSDFEFADDDNDGNMEMNGIRDSTTSEVSDTESDTSFNAESIPSANNSRVKGYSKRYDSKHDSLADKHSIFNQDLDDSNHGDGPLRDSDGGGAGSGSAGGPTSKSSFSHVHSHKANGEDPRKDIMRKARSNSMAGLFAGTGEGKSRVTRHGPVRFRGRQLSRAERWERRSHRILSFPEPLPLDESTLMPGALKAK
jgi:hypothetical protein